MFLCIFPFQFLRWFVTFEIRLKDNLNDGTFQLVNREKEKNAYKRVVELNR